MAGPDVALQRADAGVPLRLQVAARLPVHPDEERQARCRRVIAETAAAGRTIAGKLSIA